MAPLVAHPIPRCAPAALYFATKNIEDTDSMNEVDACSRKRQPHHGRDCKTVNFLRFAYHMN